MDMISIRKQICFYELERFSALNTKSNKSRQRGVKKAAGKSSFLIEPQTFFFVLNVSRASYMFPVCSCKSIRNQSYWGGRKSFFFRAFALKPKVEMKSMGMSAEELKQSFFLSANEEKLKLPFLACLSFMAFLVFSKLNWFT